MRWHGGGSRRPDRALHLVDVENLVGRGEVTGADAAWARTVYLGLGLVGPRDLVVIGCNPYVRLDVGLAWPGARTVVRHGPDGADWALLAVFDRDHAVQRFTRLVVASGDHAFATCAQRSVAHGVEVTVVARSAALSWAIRLAGVERVVAFPERETAEAPTLDLVVVA